MIQVTFAPDNDTAPLNPAPPCRRRRWWWLILLIVIPLAVFAFRQMRESRAQSRLQEAMAVAAADDPHWQLEHLQAEYERRPVNAHLVAALAALPKRPHYLGWYGDDIRSRPGALPYELEGYPNARMPEQYLTLLRERNQASLLAPLRQAMRTLAEHPGGRLPEAYRINPGRFLDDFR
jgi:hypothetical protein